MVFGVLESILGTPPSPPPTDVEPLEPDIRGAVSIRDQLKKHRTVATCNTCHQKIDPLGFALESFDEIGRHRDRYHQSKEYVRVDTSGSLPSGESFENVRDLKTAVDETIRQVRKEPYVETDDLCDGSDAEHSRPAGS